MFRTQLKTTTIASKELKKSSKKPPEEAKVFKMISMRKIVRNTKSIIIMISGFTVIMSVAVKSNKMKTE